jgi:hypothetical protein
MFEIWNYVPMLLIIFAITSRSVGSGTSRLSQDIKRILSLPADGRAKYYPQSRHRSESTGLGRLVESSGISEGHRHTHNDFEHEKEISYLQQYAEERLSSDAVASSGPEHVLSLLQSTENYR